jgi:stage II sporulation protein D
VKVHHSGGILSLQGNAFRLAAGPKELKSLSFETITERGDAIEITGAGFGHGVGLCQWGSQGLAQTGYGYAQILGKYFPGAELTKAY